jgi:pilus assembly protein CpaB
LSAKLQAEDIITLISTNNDTKATVIRDELRYVEVLAVTMPSGSDMTYQQAREKSEEDKDELPTTLTLLVNIEQARVIAELEANSRIHAALVYRGVRANADLFLAAQEAYFAEPEDEETEPEPAEIPQEPIVTDLPAGGLEDDIDAE